jgi:hypothetical protein
MKKISYLGMDVHVNNGVLCVIIYRASHNNLLTQQYYKPILLLHYKIYLMDFRNHDQV